MVTSKYSINTSSNFGDLFSVIFPDSDIAKQFQCGRTKAGFIAHFGLAPYFHKLMLPKMSDCLYISLSFDEYLNSSVQKCSEKNCVSRRYLGSEFMGRSTV